VIAMNNVTLLVLTLAFVCCMDVYYTGSGIINGDVLELNPLIAWLFKMPARIWIFVLVLVNFITMIAVGLIVQDTAFCRTCLYILIIWRFLGAQSGFIATVRHIKHQSRRNSHETLSV
jgi:hypothetical protein